MKKIWSIILFLAAFFLNAQPGMDEIPADSLEVQYIQLPDSTAIGIPFGNAVSKEIGSEGGSIHSEDGRVELVFPMGALTTSTAIRIQPVTPIIPNEKSAYQFGPSGLQFKKPVQLIYHYTEEDLLRCPAGLKFMALQDHEGRWEYTDYAEHDSISRSLKGSLSHFSVFLNGSKYYLSDSVITLKVGKTQGLHLFVVEPPPSFGPDEDVLPPLPRTDEKDKREAIWKVNASPGGTPKYGTISGQQGQAIKATYKAPAVLTMDPITVSLDLNDVILEKIISRVGKKEWISSTRKHRFKAASFSCKVKLYDEYNITVSMNWMVEGGQMSDKASFRVKIPIDDKSTISEITNQLAKFHMAKQKCKYVYVNEKTCVGLINVSGLKTTSIMAPAKKGGPLRINLFFNKAPMEFPVINFPPCAKNKGSYTSPYIGMPYAFPNWIYFEAKKEKQFVSLGQGGGSKLVAKPDPNDIIATIEPVP